MQKKIVQPGDTYFLNIFQASFSLLNSTMKSLVNQQELLVLTFSDWKINQ